MKRSIISSCSTTNTAMKMMMTRSSSWSKRICPTIIVASSNTTTSTTTSINTNNTQSRTVTVEAKRRVDFSWGQSRKAALKHTYLTVEQSKEAVNDLKQALETNYKTDIETISKMSNETQLYEKYIQYMELMLKARSVVCAKFGINTGNNDTNDRRLRLSLGRNSANDEELLKQIQDLHQQLASSCFGIEKLESRLEEIRVLGVHQLAKQQMVEAFENIAHTLTLEEFLPKSRTTLFDMERSLLKSYAIDIAKEEKRKSQFELGELSEAEKMKPYVDWMQEVQVDESEIKNKLDKPEDWITFRFILNDLLFRHG